MPTFRQAQTGLWTRYTPEDLATPQAFAQNPRLVWDWYSWRRQLTAQARPNAGHRALASMADQLASFTLITQNVDGLHQRAGSDPIELHGNIHRSKCLENNHIVDTWDKSADGPPPCPHCGAPLRPDVVWFGENLPLKPLEAALEAAQAADFFISIGTSALVQPAASLPFQSPSAYLLEINPAATALTAEADWALKGSAAQILPALVGAIWPARQRSDR